MLPKFRFFGRVSDGKMRMVSADCIDFENGYIYYHYNNYTEEEGDHVYGDCIDLEDCVPMQSTGLFDENGQEIFESDIVKTTIFFGRADESGGFYEYEKELIGIVKQLEGAWVIDTEKGAVYLWSDINENEVLGNIWENPKLLEEIKDE